MELKKVILVFKTHFDIGFTDLSSRVIESYATDMLHRVIATCRGTENMGKLRYVWTMPAWPLWYILNHCEAEDKKELERLIENGQVVWHALPFTSHTDFITPKEYQESMVYSKKLAEKYHKNAPIAAKMTDVPGHSRMVPEILSKNNVRFLHLGCNEFATPPDVPELFYWEALSGEQILTMYSKGGYGTGLLPKKDWNYPVWMALMQTSDNSGPQTASMILEMAEEIHKSYPNAEVVCGTMDDFYRELSRYDLSDIPVLQKDMADTWIHGIGAYPNETSLLRSLRRKMEAIEALHAMYRMNGIEIPQEILDQKEEYYEQIMLFEEHTWGADVKTWLPDRVYDKMAFLKARDSKEYRFMEESWEEQRERVNMAESHLERIEEKTIQLNASSSGEYFLFHGNTAPYTGWVKLPKDWKNKKVFLNGLACECEMIYGDYCCFVKELPGMQLAKLSCSDEKQKEAKEEIKKSVLENHRYRITCSDTGIESVYDKKINKVILQAKGDIPVFAYRYDRYGYDDMNEYLREYGYHFTTWGIQDYGRENYPFCEHETYYPRLSSYEIESNRIVLEYTADDKSVKEYGDAKKIVLTVSLPKAGEEIFICLQLNSKQESPFIESGSFIVPLAPESMQYRFQKGGMLLDPSKDLVDKSNHSLYCLENGMAAIHDTYALCVKSLDASLMSIGDTGIYKYSPKYEEKESNVFFNLYNNMWGTNFPQWMGGDFTYRFAFEAIDCSTDKQEALEKEIQIHLDRNIDTVLAVPANDFATN